MTASDPISLAALRDYANGVIAYGIFGKADVLALIDAVEAAQRLADAYTLSGGGADEMERLDAALSRFHPPT